VNRRFQCQSVTSSNSATLGGDEFGANQCQETAILLGLIARDDMGMSADIVRVDALSTAGLIFAVVAGGSLLKRKK